jgi:hypothetical protein
METYIVRIYRRDRDDPQKIVGLVETVGKDDKKAFASRDELIMVLEGTKKEVQQREKKQGKQSAA